MNVVDTSGWLEYFADGPNADDFSVPLKDGRSPVFPEKECMKISNSSAPPPDVPPLETVS